MSKSIKVFLSILIVLLVYPYLFVSNIKQISGSHRVSVPANTLKRGMTDTATWAKWWPGTRNADGSFHYYKVDLRDLRPQVFSVQFAEGSLPDTVHGLFEFSNSGLDSSLLSYSLTYQSKSIDPISKWMHYLQYYRHNTMMERILQKAAVHYSDPTNVYGLNIIPGRVIDTSLIATKKSFPDTPTIAEVYSLVNDLHRHISKHNGVIRDSAMLNITRLNEHEVQAMVAFPLQKDIPAEGNFVIKKMILGKLLQAEVLGGEASIAKAKKSLKNFVDDYQMSSPAIPFESLLTNRFSESDHSKWKTRLNYPIF